MSAVAKILESRDQRRRVLIVARRDGAFELVVQKWLRNVYQGRLIFEGWVSLPAHASIFESAEIASPYRDGCTNIPRAAGGAQEDETILQYGFFGHMVVRFVRLDRPEMIRFWRI